MDQGTIVMRVHGTVDPATVRALRTRIAELDDPPGRVVIDLADARDVEHLALAMLADDASQRRGPKIVLRGLCEHHLRMLRYFGHPLPVEPITYAEA
jgi:anti-anti-sigma regulatory factor